MSTEQLPADVYDVGEQPVLGGALSGLYEVLEAVYGLEEDNETKEGATGLFKAEITYGRRETCQLSLEALNGTSSDSLMTAGELASGILEDSQGDATAWNIRNPQLGKTRGVQTVSLDLIQQTDQL